MSHSLLMEVGALWMRQAVCTTAANSFDAVPFISAKKICRPSCRQISYNKNCSSVHWNWEEPAGLHATTQSKVKRLLLSVALAAFMCLCQQAVCNMWAGPWGRDKSCVCQQLKHKGVGEEKNCCWTLQWVIKLACLNHEKVRLSEALRSMGLFLIQEQGDCLELI